VKARAKLVIFDCDGVLVDSETLMVKLYREISDSVGWNLDDDEIVEMFIGRSHEHFVREFESFTGEPVSSEWETAFRDREYRMFREHLQPVDGIVSALEKITAPTCVASSGSHEKMRFTLGLTGLYSRFEGRIFSGDDVANGKPAPDLFLFAADRMNAEYSDCFVVEDSAAGVRAAKAARMRALGYAGGVTPSRRLLDAGAIVFDTMDELPLLLLSAEK
jgi:HAD superfamily hydrolase (TIGR01509 family)